MIRRFQIAVALLLLADGAQAGDWSRWRGPEGTGHVPEGVAVPTNLPAEAKVAWKLRIGDGFASPVVAGGKVYYFDNQGGQETLHALDKVTAKELWRANIDQAFTDTQSPPGPRCTPLVDGDRVYAQSCKGELRCLNATDGKLIWHVNFTKDFSAEIPMETGNREGAARHGNSGSPAIDGDKLFANVGGTNGESVVCFQKSTGKVIWKSQSDEAGYAAPMVADMAGHRQVIDFTAEGLIGLDTGDGRLLWRFPIKTTYGRHATTPVVLDDLVMVGSHTAGLMGIKVAQKGDGCEVTRAWLSKAGAINLSSPVAVGGFLYELGPNKSFQCVEIKSGKVMWSKDGYYGSSSSEFHAGLLVMGKNILVLTQGGQLVMFAADPNEFKEVGALQVCGKNWCDPAYADGQLFLRDARELLCLELIPGGR